MPENAPYNTGDKFTDAILEESRTRRQTGVSSPAEIPGYLGTPPLRQRMEGARESTNVEDRRGEVVPPSAESEANLRLVGPSPLSPARAKQAYEQAIGAASGFMEDVNDTLAMLLNPQSQVTAPLGTEEEFAQRILAQRAQGRQLAEVATTLAGTGGIAALRRPGASLGTSGGRGSSFERSFEVKEGVKAREMYIDGSKIEYRMSGSDGKKVGEYTIMEGPRPGTVSVENIEVNPAFRRQGIAKSVYDKVKNQVGDMTLVPSASLQEGTYSLWKKMNPDLLEAGRYKKLKDGSYERTDDQFTEYFNKQAAE